MPSTRKPVRAQLVVAAGATLVLLLGTPSLSAQAEPVYPSAGQVDAARVAAGDKAAQVATVEARLMASNARLAEVQTAAEVANENYNLARLLVEERTKAARAAGERATAAQKTADIASDKQGQFAATAYMQGGNLGQLEAFLASKGPQDVLDRAAGIALISDIRSRITQSAEAFSVVAGVLRRQAAQAMAQQLAAEQVADSARTAAQAEVDAAAAETANIHQQQSAMIAQLATLRNTSVALERQRQNGLKAEAEARVAAAAKAAAQARADQARAATRARAAREAASARAAAKAAAKRLRELAADEPVTPAPEEAPSPVFDGPVPARGGTGAVIAFAQAQIGEPYQWGAAGPSSWDCSGLTQMAWAQAGVYLSHYTGYQWAESRRVPLSDLRPGDLVFFGDSGPTSHHMGLYVGDDQMIEAPHSGAVVRYASIWRADILPYGGRP